MFRSCHAELYGPEHPAHRRPPPSALVILQCHYGRAAGFAINPQKGYRGYKPPTLSGPPVFLIQGQSVSLPPLLMAKEAVCFLKAPSTYCDFPIAPHPLLAKVSLEHLPPGSWLDKELQAV